MRRAGGRAARGSSAAAEPTGDLFFAHDFQLGGRQGRSHTRSSYNIMTSAADAVFHLSARAHGRDPSRDARPVHRRLAAGGHPRLHRRQVRHRRHRHGEDLVAHHLRHGQAAVRQAAGAELHDGRSQQRRQARGLVRPAEHPPLRQHAADPRRPRLSAPGRHAHHPLRRPAAGLARLAAADQRREERRAEDLGRCVRDLRILRTAGAGVRSRVRTGGELEGDPALARSQGRTVSPGARRRGHVGQPERQGGRDACP